MPNVGDKVNSSLNAASKMYFEADFPSSKKMTFTLNTTEGKVCFTMRSLFLFHAYFCFVLFLFFVFVFVVFALFLVCVFFFTSDAFSFSHFLVLICSLQKYNFPCQSLFQYRRLHTCQH